MPAGGSRQSAPAASHAKLLDVSSGILPCAEAGEFNAQSARPAQRALAAVPSMSVLDLDIGFPPFMTHLGVRHLPKVNAARCPRINSRSEIGFLGFRQREQVVAVVVLVVLGADELPPLALLLAPARRHIHGFVEGALVLDLEDGFTCSECLSVM